MVKWNLCSYCGQEKAAWTTNPTHGTPRITSFQSYGYVKPPLQQVKQLKAQASNRELFCFKSSPANPATKPASSSNRKTEKDVKRSVEKAELNKGIVKKSKTTPKRKFLSQWKDEFPWVVFHEDQNVMMCQICCSAPHVAGRTEFLAGCGTFKKETLQKHNIGGGHLRAQDAALAKQKPVENSTIAQSFQKGEKASEEKNRKDVAAKINTAYLIAKEELPLSKFEPILALQRKNGPEISPTYGNDKGCNNFVSLVSSVITEQLVSEINGKRYVSIMIDGATDASGKENETVHCRFVMDGVPTNRLVGHKEVAHAHAQGNLFVC